MSTVMNPPQLDPQGVTRVVCDMPPDPRLIWGRNHPVAEEKYRVLVHRIRVKGKQKPIRRILITSSIPGEGKSTTAANLAIVLARNGRKVLLVDTDLRVPDIHVSLGLMPQPGLAEVLEGQTTLDQAIVRIDPLGLYVLPAGRPRSNPLPLLENPSLASVFSVAESAFDYVIIDSPPLNPFADAQTIAQLADGVLLLVRWHLTPREELDSALKTLKGTPLLGLVLNGYDEPRHDQYYYKYYSRPDSNPSPTQNDK